MKNFILPIQGFLLLTWVLIASMLSCQPCDFEYNYSVPMQINDGLKVATLSDVNLDESKMTEGLNMLGCSRFNEVHSILLYRSGKLVLEEYFEGYQFQWDAPKHLGQKVQWRQDMTHGIMSCSKSFTSACIGIAIQNGDIESVHQSIFDYLPDHQEYRKNGKEKITIEHLLTMTSGLSWDEWGPHGTSENDIDRIYFECSDDPMKCVLERELIHQPGEFFRYNGGGTIILGEILRNATGLDIDSFSKMYLLNPLGIDSIGWYQFDNGTYATDGSIFLRPRDMLKIGVMYLYEGNWNGHQILNKEWISKSSELYGNNKGINVPIEDSGKNGYSYAWWTSEFGHEGKMIKMYRANGWGGQSIMVFPELEMVLVFTGGNYTIKSKPFKFIRKYILPAINSF